MTVGELIERLKFLNPSLKVMVQGCEATYVAVSAEHVEIGGELLERF